MNEELKKPYDAKLNEQAIYKIWEESGYFNPDVCIDQGVSSAQSEYFSMVLPPPNVTGTLHIGHAFEDTLQDIAVRYNRMMGKRTLWVPGADHAAIATQSKVEKILQKEGLTKNDLGREKFLERVNRFAEESKNIIISQIKRIGASLDWSRFAFTLDEKRKFAVNTAFKMLYDKQLIYRGHKVINWDPKGQTVISDDEVIHEEREGTLYTFKYWKDFPIPIATTRPETKLGDTAVAVHPDDTRYKKYIGKTFEGEFVGVHLKIIVIAEKSIDMNFGTGAVGITPAHSQTDAEIALRHKLDSIPVINEHARITIEPYKGLRTTEAREKIVDNLKKLGLLIKEEKIVINISLAERTGGVIEPLPKIQWFIDVNKEFNGKSLKKIMREAVETGKITIIPENFKKIYFNWIDNLRDWCISRQLWYGHQIPVWYRSTSLATSKSEEIYCGIEPPQEEGTDSNKAAEGKWVQDEDTLDTWFSSGLWTFSTLGWPHLSQRASHGKPGPENDLANYHPTTLIAPGYEILFFWVARMILLSGVLLNDIPFKTVYIHGMVRDKNGEKFSKSRGNGVEPIEVIEKYGADALRMALIVGVGPGSDSKYDENKVSGYKKFANKIWNISRFVFENNPGFQSDKNKVSDIKSKTVIAEFEKLVKSITSDMESYRYDIAAEKIYHYTWHTFADIIIEESKIALKEDGDKAVSVRNMLGYLLKQQLKILHPFMPFITEKIWSMIPGQNSLLIVEKWPS